MVGYQLAPSQRRTLAEVESALTRYGIAMEWVSEKPATEVRAAIEAVCARHEILRSAFLAPEPGASPLQVPGGATDLVRDGGTSGTWGLGAGPLVSCSFDHNGAELLVRTEFSPLAVDLGCLPLLVREINDQLAGTVGSDPPGYSLMAEWLNDLPGNPEAGPGLSYWHQVADRDQQVWILGLPERPEPGTGGRRAPIPLSPVAGEQLRRLADECGGMRQLLLSCWAQQIAALEGASQCLVGVFLDGRNDDDVRDLFGPLGCYAPIWLDDKSGTELASAVSAVAGQLAQASEYAEMFQPDPGIHFRYAFDYTDLRLSGDLALRPVDAASCTELAGIRLSALDLSGRLALEITAIGSECQDAALGLLARRLGHALGVLAQQGPQVVPAHLDMLPPAERVLLAEVSRSPVPAAGSIADLSAQFAERVAGAPEGLALSAADGTTTFAELEELAALAAAQLRAADIGPGDRVVLRLHPVAEQLAAMLATWRTGATAVLADVSIPSDRLADVADHCTAASVVTVLTATVVDATELTASGSACESHTVSSDRERRPRLPYLLGTAQRTADDHAD